MEKLIAPCFLLSLWATLLKKDVILPVVVPKNMLPMDVYNALLRENELQVDIEYSWITSKGRILSQSEAAKFAEENDLLDHRVTKLTSEIWTGY